jgi:putative ABC transport system permease protein
LWLTAWRNLLRSPWQSLLMVLGIMLGVAVVVGVDMANQSASKAFDLSMETITGKATHFIAGGPSGLDERLYAELKRTGIAAPAAPVISAFVTSPDLGGVPIQLLGIDPFAEAPFRDFLGGPGEPIPLAGLTRFLSQPGAILISTDLAGRYGLSENDPITLVISGTERSAFIAGLLDPQDELSRRALNGILLADIATAQELTGKLGVLDRIDLVLPENNEAAPAEINKLLPESANLLPVAARSGTVEQMTTAFRTNLSALSLLALVVGVFLIYNTITFSVVQRRSMFGTLRCLGVTRREIFVVVLSEAFLVGTLGGALGMGLGLLLGKGAVSLVTQTINDLFFVLTVQDVPIPWSSLLKGSLLGIIATVTAAAGPAWEAASVPPRAALIRSAFEDTARRVIRWVALAGLALIGGGLAILQIPTRNLVISFTGTFAVVIGFALLTPVVTRFLMRAVTPITERLFGTMGRLAPREVVNTISRTAIAVAALMIAVSVSIGVNLMVGSFRFTIETWMGQVLRGDVYISVPGAALTQAGTSIEPEVIEQLRVWPGVARADLLRNVSVDSPHGPIQVGANDNPEDAEENTYLDATGSPAQIKAAVQNGAISISEPLANRLDIPAAGGSLTLFTDHGPVDFPIAAIYYDYASVQGRVVMNLDVYRTHWDDESISAAALNLEPGVDPDALTLTLQQAFTPLQTLDIHPNRALRANTLEIFDRTFAITGALQLLATSVAFIGVLSAMLSLQLEKLRQLGILRAVGMSVRQLWTLVLLETGLIGGVAGLLAMPTGYILSLILVHIINRRSFGWTLQMQLTPFLFVQALAVAIVAALLAGLYPARRISQRDITEALRFD